MLRIRTFITAILLLSATTALLGACSRLRQPSATDRLHPCSVSEGPTDAYCGTYEVWEDRQAKAGRRIPLKIVLLPALKQSDPSEPLFVLSGGPGEGAADEAPGAEDLFRPIQRGRDIVLVDQRGTGKSNAITCGGASDPSYDGDSARLVEQRFRSCLEEYRSKADLTKYTTDLAMDDLDEIRQFLGYSKINLYGVSYGTRAAIVYARRYREHTRAVVLDSVAPPNFVVLLYVPRDSQRALDLLFDDCGKDPDCARRFPNLRERLNSLLTNLGTFPQHVHYRDPRTGLPAEREVNRLTIATALLAALQSSSTAALIPLLVEQSESGDFSGFLALADLIKQSVRIAGGMQYCVLCSEDAPRIEPGAVEREAAGTFLGPDLVKLRLKPCEFWPRATVEPNEVIDEPSDVPALLLSGELDPLTPPVWAEQLAHKWRNAKQIVVPGTGHGTISAPGVVKLIAEFVEKGDAFHLDTAFLNRLHRPPFFVAPSGPATGEAPRL